MPDKGFFDRINQVDRLIYDWMVRNNITETTPAAVMELLIFNGIYTYDNRNGKPFRDDLRELRDHGILHLFKYLDVQQENEGSSWHIYRKHNSAYDAFDMILNFSSGEKLTKDIERFERNVRNMTPSQVAKLIEINNIGLTALQSAFNIKDIAGQINVIVHTLGILNSIPYILDEGEAVESVSLGANNAGSEFDLVAVLLPLKYPPAWPVIIPSAYALRTSSLTRL